MSSITGRNVGRNRVESILSITKPESPKKRTGIFKKGLVAARLRVVNVWKDNFLNMEGLSPCAKEILQQLYSCAVKNSHDANYVPYHSGNYLELLNSGKLGTSEFRKVVGAEADLRIVFRSACEKFISEKAAPIITPGPSQYRKFYAQYRI